MIELANNGPKARRLASGPATNGTAASICRCLRGLTPDSLEAFDLVEQGLVTGSRDTTTVAGPGALPAERPVRPAAVAEAWPDGYCNRGRRATPADRPGVPADPGPRRPTCRDRASR